MDDCNPVYEATNFNPYESFVANFTYKSDWDGSIGTVMYWQEMGWHELKRNELGMA